MTIDFALLRRQNPITPYLRRHGVKMANGKFSCVAPGHDDRNPSASIYDDDEKWKCHACDIGGDIVDLEMLRTGCDKREAIQNLGGEEWSAPNQPPPPRGAKPKLVREFGPPPPETPLLRPGTITLWKTDLSGVYPQPVDHVYEYRDRDNVLQGYVFRRDAKGSKGKEVFPVRWHNGKQGFTRAGWVKGEPRPLYNEPALFQRPNDPVLVVEGERCTVVAQALFPDMVVVSWWGGKPQAEQTDWSVLKGRHVTLWRDNDHEGREAMDIVAKKAAGATLKAVPMQDDWPKGHDVADLAQVPGQAEAVLQTAIPYRFDVTPKGTPSGSWVRISEGGWLPDDAHLIRSPNGLVKTSSTANGMRALLHHPAFASLTFDIMRQEIRFAGQPLPGDQIFKIQAALHEYVGLDIVNGFDSMLQNAAISRPVNPLADAINGLAWDRQERLRYLPGYFGVEATPWAQAAFLRWFLGHVQRILEPGYKQDLVLVLEGEQGIGKSTALEVLGTAFDFPGYVRIGSIGTGTKMNDSEWMAIAGKTVVELGELSALGKAQIEHFKDVVTRSFDEYRKPYGRDVTRVDRTASFVGTTNQTADYLTDPTGNRRFAPVTCVDGPDLEAIRANRNQLHAEALVLLKGGEQTYFTEVEIEMQQAETARRRSQSVTLMKMEEYIHTMKGVTFIPVTHLMTTLQGHGDPTLRERNYTFELIKKTMQAMGWTLQKQTQEDGSRVYGFTKVPKSRGGQRKRTLHPASKLFAKKDDDK